MADGITIKFEDAEIESLVKRLLRRVKNPMKLQCKCLAVHGRIHEQSAGKRGRN